MPAHTIEISLERQGSLTVFDIRGYVSMGARTAIDEAYEVIDPETGKTILLRFDEETYFNSEGIKSILEILVEAMKNDQKVGITGLSKHFKKIFGMVGVSKLATIFDNESDAFQGLGAAKG
jgi:anti-anti-sigma regulatory factor